jgi:hypothetical protein
MASFSEAIISCGYMPLKDVFALTLTFYPENGVEKNRPLSENETVSLVKRCLQSPDGTKQLLSVISEIIAGGSL